MGTIWVGVDVGKNHHHVAAVDDAGKLVLSQQLANDQKAITAIVAQIGRRRGQTRWGVGLRTGPAALLLAVLLGKGADVRYVSGSVTSRMAEAFHGEHKTDAKDALVIAQTLRMRSDLPKISTADQIQTELKLLTARRLDLVDERVRTILRLQDLLGTVSPAVARVLDLTKKGPVRLLAKWQTPAAIRRAGPARIAAELRTFRITNAAALADRAVAAARTQTVAVAGEATAALIIEQLAADLQALDDRIATVEDLIEAALARHELTPVITSLPGMGPVLAAEFIAHAANPRRLPQPRRPGRARRSRPRRPGLRPGSGSSAATPPVSPRTAPDLQHLHPWRAARLPNLPGLLRPKTRRGKNPPPGSRGPVSTPRRRALGLHPRQQALPAQTVTVRSACGGVSKPRNSGS